MPVIKRPAKNAAYLFSLLNLAYCMCWSEGIIIWNAISLITVDLKARPWDFSRAQNISLVF